MTDEGTLRTAEERRCKAIVAGDIASLETMLSDDLVHVHTVGLIDDKASYLAGIRDRLEVQSVERGPLAIRRYGTAAVMTGELTNTVRRRADGPDADWMVLRSFATQVWHCAPGGWVMASFHASRLAEA